MPIFTLPMKKTIFSILLLLSVSTYVFAKGNGIKINSKTFYTTEEKIDNFAVFGTNYFDDKSSLVCIEYAIDLSRPGDKAYWCRYNNPYLVDSRDGAQDIILLYKNKSNGKFYVGSYSIIVNIGYSYPMVAFEYDNWSDARDVYFLWLYLKYLQSTQMTEVHFRPTTPDFWWDENGEYFYANIPKDMIDANYKLYVSRGYENAFTNDMLLMDGQWHDLSNGKIYQKDSNKYSSVNGTLYCNGKIAYLQNDINKMIRIYTYSNSNKFVDMLRSGISYYYCERCANNPYDATLRPIELYGCHYQETSSKNLHKEKVVGICNSRMDDFDWKELLGIR